MWSPMQIDFFFELDILKLLQSWSKKLNFLLPNYYNCKKGITQWESKLTFSFTLIAIQIKFEKMIPADQILLTLLSSKNVLLDGL